MQAGGKGACSWAWVGQLRLATLPGLDGFDHTAGSSAVCHFLLGAYQAN